MSYETARDDAEFDRLKPRISDFLKGYLKNPVSPGKRRTIILFPGGLGSSLVRAKTAYKPGAPTPQFEDFWITLDLLFGGVDNVAMNGDEDSDERFVLPAAEVKIFGVGPYNNFEAWCASQNIDLFVFGYDWRRKPEYTVDFFFNRFLPELKAQWKSKPGPTSDPLDNLTLVGHSLGGMLVKLIMNDATFASRVSNAITVGSPFYGYAGQTLRYFEGEKEFFLTSKKKMAEIIATLEGGYYLQFLDEDTYDKFGPALGAVKDYPLNAYPSLDPNGARADPFQQVVTVKAVRYPPWVETGQLGGARDIVKQLAEELPPQAARKFFNIRGVQVENGKDRANTYNAQTWSLVAPNFDPDKSPVPIQYVSGPGDSTIPAWSSRLIGLENNYPDHVTTLKGNVEHMFLMEIAQTQDRILQILYADQPQVQMDRIGPKADRDPPRIDIATDDVASGFVQNLKTFKTVDAARAALDKYQKTQPRAEVEKMARGILSLLVSGAARPIPEPKPPKKRGLTAPAPDKRKSAGGGKPRSKSPKSRAKPKSRARSKSNSRPKRSRRRSRS